MQRKEVKLIIIAAVTVFACAIPAVAHDTATEHSHVVRRGQAEGVTIDSDVTRAIDLFGNPDNERTVYESRSGDGNLIAFEWDGLEIQYFENEDYINYIAIRGEQFALSNGITVGDSAADVAETLGQPHNESQVSGGDGVDYVRSFAIRDESGMGGTEIEVRFDADTVTGIILEGFSSSCF